MESPVEASRVAVDSMPAQNILHDSMVTVRLSEPPSLHLDTNAISPSATEIQNKQMDDASAPDTPNIMLEGVEEDNEDASPQITMMDPNGNEVLSPSGSESPGSRDAGSRRGSDSSEASVEGGGVNWEELEKTEEQEPRNESSDDVSIAISSLEVRRCACATN
jgi:hypothetical protein